MKPLTFLLPIALFAAADDSFLLTNVTVHPVTGPDVAKASILVRDGRIADVGLKIAKVSGIKVVDGKGLHVYPGMINCATQIGLQEVSSVRETVDTGELGQFNPQLRALIAVNPESDHIPVTRANGITAVLTMPGGGGFGGFGGPVIPGQASLMHLDGWTWEEMEINRAAVMMLRFPAVQTRSFNAFEGGFTRSPYTEAKKIYDKEIKDLGDFFERARAYEKAKNVGATGFRTDLTIEAMLPVLSGKLPVMAITPSARSIRDALAFAGKQKIRVILAGLDEPGDALKDIKAASVPVILGKSTRLPSEDDDAYDVNYSLPAQLHKLGIKFAFGTFDIQFARNLGFEAGFGVGYGLPAAEALKAVTINAAEIFGIDKDYGSIDKGKWADLVVTDGDPLEHRTQVRMVFIKGKQSSLETKHTKLYEKYLARP